MSFLRPVVLLGRMIWHESLLWVLGMGLLRMQMQRATLPICLILSVPMK
jgi:hypothetical protein